MPKKTLSPSATIWFRAACEWSRECDSPLCPLDPDLEQKKPSKLTPLCYWYLRLVTLDEAEDIPDYILNLLMRYVIHLLNLRHPDLNASGFPQQASKTPTRIDDLHKGKGIVQG